MDILDFECNLEYGFAWILVGCDGSEPLTVQCCLENEDGKATKKIDMSNCGYDWGICADANEKAFKKFGSEKCMSALFEKAKENGIEVY